MFSIFYYDFKIQLYITEKDLLTTGHSFMF